MGSGDQNVHYVSRSRRAGRGARGATASDTRGATDPTHDLALLRIEGAPLPALAVRDSDGVREGEAILFTGYPIRIPPRTAA